MRTETPTYKTSRLQWTTRPRVFVRPSFVRKSGDVKEYPFARDLASHDDVDASLRPKLVSVKTVSGAASQADPISGRTSVGFLEVQLGGEAARRQIADPARPLQVAIAGGFGPTLRNGGTKIGSFAATTGAALTVQVDDIRGYPDLGTITIDNEDFGYLSRDLVTNTFTDVYPASRDTVSASHVVGARVRNGEQLRRGTRIALYLGYAQDTEAFYGPGPGFTKMEIQSTQTQDFNLTVALRCSDIQRFTKRRVFEGASQLNPATLGPDHPITLGLKVLTSTGLGTNGPYDLLAKEFGAAVPYQLIDIAGLELLRNHPDISNVRMQFAETASQDVKDWIETQIFRPLSILPDVNQAGQYTGRLLTAPPFADMGLWGKAMRAVA
jgi:hypothetical protein